MKLEMRVLGNKLGLRFLGSIQRIGAVLPRRLDFQLFSYFYKIELKFS